MQTINDVKRRVVSSYPDWYSWTMLQRQILMLRASHGSFHQKGMFNPLTELSKIFGIDVATLMEAIESTPSLMSALSDYAKDNAYRHGKSKSGKKMQRRTKQSELLELIAYDSIPSVIVAIQSGSRPRISKSEQPFFEKWLEEFNKKPTRRRKGSIDDDGLWGWPRFNRDEEDELEGLEEPIKPFVRDINPEEQSVDPESSLPVFDTKEPEEHPDF